MSGWKCVEYLASAATKIAAKFVQGWESGHYNALAQ